MAGRRTQRQALFREVNKRILEVFPGVDQGDDPQLLCECGDESCIETMPVSAVAYRELRAASRLLVAPGHEAPLPQNLVEEVARAGEPARRVEVRTHERLA